MNSEAFGAKIGSNIDGLSALPISEGGAAFGSRRR
jgi:hypothetical protein